jgi:hypothetical protein
VIQRSCCRGDEGVDRVEDDRRRRVQTAQVDSYAPRTEGDRTLGGRQKCPKNIRS